MAVLHRARCASSSSCSATSGRTTPPVALVPGPFSVLVESEDPIAAERLTLWGHPAAVGAHATSGVAAPARDWTFAEGSTRSGFQLFYLLSNPGDTETRVRIQYLCAGSTPGVREHVVAARGRLTIWVNQEGAPLDGAECGARLTSDRPIVAERSLYILRDGTFTAGTSSAGVPHVTSPSVWWFAEGATADPFDQFLAIVNPSGASAEVEITYLLPGGVTVQRTHWVPSGQRATIWVDHEDPLLWSAPSLSIRVESRTAPIAVERAM